MTFQELLLNLLGTYTSKKLRVVAKEWEGELLIKGDAIILAEVHDDKEISGIDALKFMFEEQNNIDRIEFLPYENGKSNLRINQMDLFGLIHGEIPSETGQEEVFEEETFKLEEREKKKPVEIPRKFFEVCRKYFRQENLRLVYCKGNLEFSSLSSPEDVLNFIQNLIQKIKDEKPCNVRKLLIRFNRIFCLIFLSNENFGVLAADIEEYPNYELDQPFIDKELFEVLTS